MDKVKIPKIKYIDITVIVDLEMPNGEVQGCMLFDPEDFYNGIMTAGLPLLVVMRDKSAYFGFYKDIEEIGDSGYYAVILRLIDPEGQEVRIPIAKMLGYREIYEWS